MFFVSYVLIFSHRDMIYYIRKQHVKFESIIIIKSEEMLVLMVGT